MEKARIEEPIDPATYYKVNLKGEIAEEKNDLDCVTNYKLFRLGFLTGNLKHFCSKLLLCFRIYTRVGPYDKAPVIKNPDIRVKVLTLRSRDSESNF